MSDESEPPILMAEAYLVKRFEDLVVERVAAGGRHVSGYATARGDLIRALERGALIEASATDLVRDLAACRTFEELCESDGDEPDPPVAPSALDELILRARNIVDDLGLSGERLPTTVPLPW